MDGTPKKLTECISPLVSHDYCVVCIKDVREYKTPKDHKVNLFHPSGQITEFGQILEAYLNVELRSNDFRIACKACYRSVKSAVKYKEEKRTSLLTGRETIREKYLLQKGKRCVPTDAESPPGSKRIVLEKPERRRQLNDAWVQTDEQWPFRELGKNLAPHFQDGVVKERVQVISVSAGLTITVTVPSDLQPIVRCLCSENYQAIANSVWKHPKCREELEKIVSREVAFECSKICSNQESPFKAAGERSITQFSFVEQEKEVEKSSPLFWKLVVSAGSNKKNLSRNKRKKIESLKPALLTSIAVILKCRNQRMNMNALVNSIILRRGGADKMTYKRMNQLGLCTSYGKALSCQSALGKDNTSAVKCWAGANDGGGTEKGNEKLETTEVVSMDENISTANSPDQQPIRGNNEWVDASPNVDGIESKHSVVENDLQEIQQAASVSIESWDEWDFLEDKEDILNLSTALEDFSIQETSSKRCTHQTANEFPLPVSTTRTVPCFVLAGDNVNFAPKSRHTNRSKPNEQINLFNCIATKKRVPYAEERIDGKVPLCTAPVEVPLKVFLPGENDNAFLRAEFRHKIGSTLVKYIKEVKWFEKFLPKHLQHENMRYTKSKSETVCLGVLSKDENVTKDIKEIMQFLHQFVPNNDTETQHVLSFGDELTCEREHNAQEDQRDAPTIAKRMAGLIPCIADFHTFGNFLMVVWNILYDTESAADIGTLHAARNFLNARNVPLNPMDNVDATYDFLEQYTDAMILAAFEEVKGQGNNTRGIEEEQEEVMKSVIDTIVDTFVLPSIAVDWKPEETQWTCKECNKKYKKIAGLRKHRKDKHGDRQEFVKGYECKHCDKFYARIANFKKHIVKHRDEAGVNVDDQSINEEIRESAVIPETLPESNVGQRQEVANEADYVHLYSRCSLLLGLFACNFTDARKHGDGNRVLRLYKFLFLMFKMVGKTKYAFYSFQYLCQVFYLLPDELAFDIVFNRFTNNRGHLDSNVEIDREVEHWNKLFKMDCKEFNGKITTKSIERASCSYQSVEAILKAFDTSTSVHSPSGKHVRKNADDDVIALSEQFKNENLFQVKPGRKHGSYPDFPENLFSRLDAPSLKEWMMQKVKHFRGLHVYSQFV